MMKQIGIILIGLFLLMGCSQPPIKDDASKQKQWQERLQVLVSKHDWGVKGRASVTFQDENYPFGMEWNNQADGVYDLLIRHPLNQSLLAKINAQRGSVTLTTNRNQTLRGSSAETLIQQQLGFSIPVQGMQYWVKGVPSPSDAVQQLMLDDYGRPLSMNQAGWKISYGSYQGNEQNALPGLVEISRTQPSLLRVKLRLKNWQVR